MNERNNDLISELQTFIAPEKAAFYPQFFKTIPGGMAKGIGFGGYGPSCENWPKNTGSFRWRS